MTYMTYSLEDSHNKPQPYDPICTHSNENIQQQQEQQQYKRELNPTREKTIIFSFLICFFFLIYFLVKII
ncbi:hypothetical protein DOY81_002160 [Sarcophaga bullata]|nr:hypothetical protein DOY81_002160 [Sarcophaga bullata]